MVLAVGTAFRPYEIPKWQPTQSPPSGPDPWESWQSVQGVGASCRLPWQDSQGTESVSCGVVGWHVEQSALVVWVVGVQAIPTCGWQSVQTEGA